jgi:LAS superfamily LD-carboxypeptidase LdcB
VKIDSYNRLVMAFEYSVVFLVTFSFAFLICWQFLPKLTAHAEVVNNNEYRQANIDSSIVHTNGELPTINTQSSFAPAYATYSASEVEAAYKSLFAKKVYSLKCDDCTLAPVGKSNSLPSSYKPKVTASKKYSNLELLPESLGQVEALLDDLKSAGFSPGVNSSYRSYDDQLKTFSYWVNSEVQKGKSIHDAILAANEYSALPGLSEHQLGTTLDVSCSGCSAFNTQNQANLAFWKLLHQKAHLYGFVISYPEGKENLTGYNYEPWHIRYVGKEIAKQLYEANYLKPDTDIYSEKYLASLIKTTPTEVVPQH